VSNQDQERTIRLRNKWVKMDPRTWNADMDVRINVGLGFGNEAQKMAFLGQILNMQKEAMANGLPMVTMKELHNTAEEVVKVTGLGSVGRYFKDPSAMEQQQPQQEKPDPEMMKLQQEAQIEQAKMQQDAALKKQEMEQNFALKREQLQMEVALKREQMQMEAMYQANTAQNSVQFGGEPG